MQWSCKSKLRGRNQAAVGDCSSSLFVCPSGCNWPGHRKLFSTILCLPVENAKGRLWSCKGDSAEGIRLLWAIVPAVFLYARVLAIGLGTGICFPLFYACLWKMQREDYGRAREITWKESGCYGRLFQQPFCMPERLQLAWAQKPVFHYFWPVCGKCKGKTMVVQGK